MNEKTLRTTVAVVLVMGLVVVGLVLRGRDRLAATPEAAGWVLPGRDRLQATPEAVVSEFFDAAKRGDDRAYLRFVDGELRKSLAAERSQQGGEAFREGIRRTAAGIKGLATMPSSDAPDGMVALDVDIVFADRIESQRMLLRPKGNGWIIASIGAAQMSKPPVAYGTPVFESVDNQSTESPQIDE